MTDSNQQFYRDLFRDSRDGLLLFRGARLVEANGVGLRTFRAAGNRTGAAWVPWLEQQLEMFGRSGTSQWRGLYQRPRGERIAQYAVRMRRDGSTHPAGILVRSHFLGWVDLREVPLDPAIQATHVEELKVLLDSTLVGKLLLAEDGQVLYANPVAASLFGKQPSDLLGCYLGQSLQIGQVVEIDIPVGNEVRTAEISLLPTPWPRETVYLATLTDVSERNRSREQLRLLQQAWEYSPVALMVTDVEQSISYVNPAFEQMTGYRLEDIRGHTPQVLASGETPASVYGELWRHLEEGRVWRGEFLNRRRNGELYWEQSSIAPVRDGDGEISHYVALKEDISERKRAEQQLQHQAHHDALTGLPNRQLLTDLLASMLLLEHRREGRLAVLFLDLDRFKQVNDTAGHEVGDELLREVAERLRKAVRREDVVARQSGDEFIILCPDLEEQLDADPIARRILTSLREPIVIRDHVFYVGGSIGISGYPESGHSSEELLRQADQAMYSAKRAGGDQVRYFSAELNEQRAWRTRAETLLRRALDREELEVVYQPIVQLSNGQPIGAEALLRWYSPELGQVPPSQFIELAESTGQIEPLGAWVLQKAVTELRRWSSLAATPLWVSVNLSPHQLRTEDFSRQVVEQVKELGLKPGQLKLEVTEEQLLEDVAHVGAYLRLLDQAGIQLAIDDFGTGYSSLAYLRQFPFRVLKIDRTFVQDVPYQPDACILVRTILAMAQEMGLIVVAEGVETDDQVNFLRRYGCLYGQGYIFSRPLRPEEFRRWLQPG